MSFWKPSTGGGDGGAVIQASNKRVSLTKSVVQAITSGADRVITWDTEIMDTDSMHEGVTNPARITFTTAGTYYIGASLQTSANALLTAKILLNAGATQIAYARMSNSNPQGVVVETMYTFAANDYIYVTINPSSNGNVAAASSFFAVRISE